MKANRVFWILCIALTQVYQTASADDRAPDVRRLMTADELRMSGLLKLNDAEIDALNAWLIRYTARDAAYVKNSNPAVVAESNKAAAEVIRSRMAGAFMGWTGNTTFVLANGQSWRQRGADSYYYIATDPEVEISANALGFYWLTLVATGKRVAVKRIN